MLGLRFVFGLFDRLKKERRANRISGERASGYRLLLNGVKYRPEKERGIMRANDEKQNRRTLQIILPVIPFADTELFIM